MPRVTFGTIATTSPSRLFRNCSSFIWSFVILISKRWTLYFTFSPPVYKRTRSTFCMRNLYLSSDWPLRPNPSRSPRNSWPKRTADHPPRLPRLRYRLSVFYLPSQETSATKKTATAWVKLAVLSYHFLKSKSTLSPIDCYTGRQAAVALSSVFWPQYHQRRQQLVWFICTHCEQ